MGRLVPVGMGKFCFLATKGALEWKRSPGAAGTLSWLFLSALRQLQAAWGPGLPLPSLWLKPLPE